MDQKRKILLGLTTTPLSDWREKVQEIDQLNLKEMAFFPTFLKLKERKELYALLEKTGLREFPHVHLKDDMELWEVEYFLQRWKTQVFNIHPDECFLKFIQEESWRKMIFVENHKRIDAVFARLVEQSAGICVDFAHWRDRRNGLFLGYGRFKDFLKKYPIGCCHVSAARKKWGFVWEDDHYFKNLSDFDYLQKFVAYFPAIVSLELENSLMEQMEAKKYLEKTLFSPPALEK